MDNIELDLFDKHLDTKRNLNIFISPDITKNI